MEKLFVLGLVAVSLFAGELTIDNIYAKKSPKANNAAIFMNINNGLNADVKLVSASSSFSDNVELHTHKMVDGMMMMSMVNGIKIQKDSTTQLKPGGLHIMLIGLKKPLQKGDSVDLTLNFNTGKSVKIEDISVVDGKKVLFLEK